MAHEKTVQWFLATCICMIGCSLLVLASDCEDMYTCDGCVRKTSWSGVNCRWCPLDRKCHAAGNMYRA